MDVVGEKFARMSFERVSIESYVAFDTFTS